MSPFPLICDLPASPEKSDLKLVWKLAALSLTLHLTICYFLLNSAQSISKPAPAVIMVEMAHLPDRQHPDEKPEVTTGSRPKPVAAPVTTAVQIQALPSMAEKVVHSQQALPRENVSNQMNPAAPASVQAAPVRQDVISERPHSVQPVRQASSAPPPPAVDTGRIRNAYHARIREMIERNKEYPVMARRGRLEGKVSVRFIVARNGKLKHVAVASPSAYSLLNQAALGAVGSVDRFPPLPGEITGDEAVFEVPIAFSLSGN